MRFYQGICSLIAVCLLGCATAPAGPSRSVVCSAADDANTWKVRNGQSEIQNNPCGKPTQVVVTIPAGTASLEKEVPGLPSGPSDYYLAADIEGDCAEVRMVVGSPGSPTVTPTKLRENRYALGGYMRTSELVVDIILASRQPNCRMTIGNINIGRDVPEGMQKMPMPPPIASPSLLYRPLGHGSPR